MKGDFTRFTFDRALHFRAVPMQQGRVQLDADWNESDAIGDHLRRSITTDTIGPSGAPDRAVDGTDGFAIVAAGAKLTVGKGRYYVDGVLCENEATVPIDAQPELPGATHPDQGSFVIYLRAFDRHVTTVEAPSIREPALGGPDTATRIRTTWQVRWHPVASGATCSDTTVRDPAFPATDALLAARARTDDVTETCGVKPGAQYTRLENHLYRIEVHEGGDLAGASFKWSRDNAMVVAALGPVEPGTAADSVTVGSAGRDTTYGFVSGCFVELFDDRRELNFLPGDLRQVERVEGNRLLLTVPGGVHLKAGDYGPGARVRRWDGVIDPFTPQDDGFVALEDGVRVRITGTRFNSADYWAVPARTNEGDVEWPQSGTGVPAQLPPKGKGNRLAKLAIVDRFESSWKVQDCRQRFPSLTAMEQLSYLSGDGQTVTPRFAAPAAFLPLPQRPMVGVSRGTLPVPDARVRFTIHSGAGRIPGADTDGSRTFRTTTAGIAECAWELDSVTPHQSLEARLVDDAGLARHLPVIFNASLDMAATVAYQAGACPGLAGAATVQEALDTLCLRPSDGGCCVHVATQDELKLALANAPAGPSACICLDAGTYDWPGGLMLTGEPQSFTIRGRQRATQLRLSAPLRVQKLTAFTIEDMAVVGTGLPSLLSFNSVGRVSVDGCQVLLGEAPREASAIRVENCDRVHVQRSEITCAFKAERGFVPLKRLLPIELLRVTGALSSGGSPAALSVVRGILALPEAQRAALSESVLGAVARNERNLEVQEQASMRALAQSVSAANQVLMFEAATQLRDQIEGRAARVNGAAVALLDGTGDVWLRDNTLTGALILYGEPTGTINQAFVDLATEVGQSLPGTGTADGQLLLAGNQLDRVGTGNLAQVRDRLIGRLFSRFRAEANSFAVFPNEFEGGAVILSDNTFDLSAPASPPGGPPFFSAAVGAEVATFTGNAAERLTRIRAVATTAEAGNVRVTLL